MIAPVTERQRLAIASSQARRLAELQPLRAQVAAAIALVGWPRARPVVEAVMGYPVKQQRGRWWAGVGKRKAAALLSELDRLTRQERLVL